jgi:hypothetical protein
MNHKCLQQLQRSAAQAWPSDPVSEIYGSQLAGLSSQILQLKGSTVAGNVQINENKKKHH